MSQHPPEPPGGEHPGDADDVTRELPVFQPPRSPWARPEQPPADQPPADQPPMEYLPPSEPRFAGPPYGQPPAAYAPPGAYPPGTPQHGAPYTSPYDTSSYGTPPYGSPAGAGSYSQPWAFPDPSLTPGGGAPWPDPTRPSPRRGRILAAVLALVLVAAAATGIVLGTSSSKKSASPTVPGTPPSPTGGPGGATPAPSTTPVPSPTDPLPSIGVVPTPAGLAAIGYHAYRLALRAPADIALGPQEIKEFSRYGLSRIVDLRALSVGDPTDPTDDYDASINILRFRDAAGAKAELDYSNSQNKKDSTTVALPGLPTATAFVTRDPATGVSIGAFITSGRYQVVVIVGGLSPNVPTDVATVAAEAARVMKAVLPDAATIVPPASGGGGSPPEVPTVPTPAATGTHA